MRQKALAVAVAAVLMFGVLGALTVDPDSASQRVTAAGPSTTAPADDATTTTTEAPTTTVAPAPVPAPSPAAKPKTTTTTVAGRDNRGSYPGSVSFPFQAGRTSWSGTSNGVDMAVSIDKAHPKTGEPVTFTFTLTNNAQKCCGFGVIFGDGGPSFYQDNSCPVENRTPVPGTVTTKTTRAYNKAGRWKFTFSGWTLDCVPNQLYGHLYGWIEVAPGGATTSQGPSLPTFKTVARYGPTQYDNDPSYVSVVAQSTDVDGYIAKLVVDYGDGTTETFPEQGWGCRQTESGWPEQSFMQTPTNPPPTHRYAAPGTYTITVTAYSQGCDGRDVQTGTGSFQHVY